MRRPDPNIRDVSNMIAMAGTSMVLTLSGQWKRKEAASARREERINVAVGRLFERFPATGD